LGEVAHGRRVAESFMRCDRTTHDTPKAGTDLVGTALVRGVTARTLAEGRFSCRSIGAGKKRRDRHGSFFLGAALLTAGFRGDNGEACLFRYSRVPDTLRRNRNRHHHENGG